MKPICRMSALVLFFCLFCLPVRAQDDNSDDIEPTEARFYCTSFLPGETDPHLISTTSESHGFAYRSALQDCRYLYPDRAPDCRVQCLRIR